MKLVIFCFVLLIMGVASLYGAAGELVIGGDVNFPPYEYLDDSGDPTGYNVELSGIIAQRLELKPVWKLMKWARIREELDNGSIDLIQGIAFSPARAQELQFSNPHTNTWRTFFVRNNSRFTNQDQLKKAEILVQEGDIALDYIRDNEFAGKVVELPTQEDVIHLLSTGVGDAALINYMNGMHLIKTLDLENIIAIRGEIQPRYYCMASKDPELIARIDKVLSQLESDGTLEKLQNKWFGEYSSKFTALANSRSTGILPLVMLLLTSLATIALLAARFFPIKRKLQDCTEAGKLTEHELEELRRDYQIFLKGPIVVYKHKTKPYSTIYVSDGLRAWGYDPQLAIENADNYTDIVFSEDRPEVDQLLESQISNGIETELKQYRIVTKSGEIRWVLDYNQIIKEDSGEYAVYGYMVDITSQKALEAELLEAKEKAETASIAKGHFLANMSHEIRTPLNGIMGFVQVLMQMEASPEQREYYDIIYSSGQSLMKIVNDILDVSKIESGKMDLIFTDFNPAYLIRDMVKSFAYQREKAGVDIRSNINENLPALLNGDMLRLRQVLINLLQNAMKFTEEGYIEVSAEVYNRSDSDIRILFCVKDTGIGIDPMKQKDIFDNFSQLDNRITRKYGGTGLGLSIVKRLVELMGGFIWVESKPNEGSSFFFILPFRLQNEVKAEHILTRQQELREEFLPHLKVLLVEDELVNQSATKKQLEQWQLDVTIANNGQEAVDLYQQMDFDCILMDVHMPVMDGVTATHKIREIESLTGRKTIIYAYTAAAMSGDRERFIASGMDDYISKPVDLELLFSLLMKVKPRE